MKKCFGIILILAIVFGCETESKLTFDTLQLGGENCKDCPKIDITIPNAMEETSVATAINRSLSEEIISLLSFTADGDIDSMDKAIASFSQSYKEIKEKFSEEMPWEAQIDGKVVYEDDNIVTIKLNSYSFTGGAHGYATTSFLNFDKVEGTELENYDLFEDYEGFAQFAEAQFRDQEKIPQDKNINATGFMFEGDAFHLAQNVGYTPNGIQMVYNQYEVASYADGPIVLTLSFDDINKYLKFKTIKS
ncbi:MAG: DUF3298 and DUF4163 domain-containing protein [Bacteroidota bacterium]|nr:DUF3298 and DUF4163 domain-containing protein [Bacteroidota bacterium]